MKVSRIYSKKNKSFRINIKSLQTNLPVFRLKECSVRRRYSDFDWLRKELERDSKVSSLSHMRINL